MYTGMDEVHSGGNSGRGVNAQNNVFWILQPKYFVSIGYVASVNCLINEHVYVCMAAGDWSVVCPVGDPLSSVFPWDRRFQSVSALTQLVLGLEQLTVVDFTIPWWHRRPWRWMYVPVATGVRMNNQQLLWTYYQPRCQKLICFKEVFQMYLVWLFRRVYKLTKDSEAIVTL